MIPEPQHNDSLTSEELRSFLIANLTGMIVMSATVYFNCELCARTIEIKYVSIEWMLPTKFVTCEIPVP